jgi:hypothetical protein
LSRIWLLFAIVTVAFLAVFSLPAVQPAHSQAVLPDSIMFVGGQPVLQAGGNNYTIDIQLMIRGANYSGNNFGIYFRASDLSLIDIPEGSSIVTDSNGRASLNITTGQGYGNVTITASMLSPDGSVRASKTYAVMAAGNVTGTVVEASGRRISGALVTLYTLENGEKGSALTLTGNPVSTTDEGSYAIENVPYGSYVIEAAVDDQNASYNVTVAAPTQSLAIAIPGYTAPTPTPTPEPTLAPTEVPSPTVTPVPASPSPAGKTPTGDTTRQLLWIGGIALVLAIIIIGAQWLRHKKPKK